MGLLSAFGSGSRVVGPIFVSYIYTLFGTYWIFGSMAVTMIVSLMLVLSTYKRLVPMTVDLGGHRGHRSASHNQDDAYEEGTQL